LSSATLDFKQPLHQLGEVFHEFLQGWLSSFVGKNYRWQPRQRSGQKCSLLQNSLKRRLPPDSSKSGSRYENKAGPESERVDCEPREAPSIEQQGRLPPQEQSRRAAKSARWEGLTFDTKSEIIVGVEWIAVVPANSTLFSPSSALIYPSFIGSCLLRIRNP
jgi:hypothetical protein